MSHTYRPPIGGVKQHLPELTDHCRPAGRERTHAEHIWPNDDTANICPRCGGPLDTQLPHSPAAVVRS